MSEKRYDYECVSCGNVTAHFVMFEAREVPKVCPECGGKAKYCFPVDAILGFQPFSPYYDEALGVDIHGRREKKETLRAYGLQEAGDRVGGARNEEKASSANRMRPLPPRGITLSQMQQMETLNRKAADAFEIGVVERETGKTIMPRTRARDLPSA